MFCRKKVEKIKKEWRFDLPSLFYRLEGFWEFGLILKLPLANYNTAALYSAETL